MSTTKLDQYLTLAQAAEFLGVPVYTLRNWLDQGKLPMHRNPMNNYRIVKKKDLENLLAEVEQSASPPNRKRNKRKNKPK